MLLPPTFCVLLEVQDISNLYFGLKFLLSIPAFSIHLTELLYCYEHVNIPSKFRRNSHDFVMNVGSWSKPGTNCVISQNSERNLVNYSVLSSKGRNYGHVSLIAFYFS